MPVLDKFLLGEHVLDGAGGGGSPLYIQTIKRTVSGSAIAAGDPVEFTDSVVTKMAAADMVGMIAQRTSSFQLNSDDLGRYQSVLLKLKPSDDSDQRVIGAFGRYGMTPNTGVSIALYDYTHGAATPLAEISGSRITVTSLDISTTGEVRLYATPTEGEFLLAAKTSTGSWNLVPLTVDFENETITDGDVTDRSADSTSTYVGFCVYDARKVAMLWQSADATFTYRIMTWDGSGVWTINSSSTFSVTSGDQHRRPATVAYSASKILMAYQTGTSSYTIRMCALNISGSTITRATEYTSGYGSDVDDLPVMLDLVPGFTATKVYMGYATGSGGYGGAVLTFNGSTDAFSSGYAVDSEMGSSAYLRQLASWLTGWCLFCGGSDGWALQHLGETAAGTRGADTTVGIATAMAVPMGLGRVISYFSYSGDSYNCYCADADIWLAYPAFALTGGTSGSSISVAVLAMGVES